MRSAILACILLTQGVGRAAAFTTEPLLDRNGARGGPTCRECHLHRPARAEAGTLGILGLPERYTPGQSYTLTVTLDFPGMKRAGFQISARADDGAQAGTLASADARSTVEQFSDNGVSYAFHTEEGLALSGGGQSRWAVTWTAPGAAQGPVTFDAAANASNADDSALGDAILLFNATVQPLP